MLVAFPIALFITSLACDIVFHAITPNPFWKQAAFWALVGGIGTALLAAIPGAIDYFALHDRETMRLATIHMVMNLTLVVVMAANVWWRLRSPIEARGPVVLTALADAWMVVSGWLGATLVHLYGVGVADAAHTNGHDRRPFGERRPYEETELRP